MKLKNKIITYFVIPASKGSASPRVLRSKVSMDPDTAKELIEKQFKKAGRPPLPAGNLLQVCYDFDSEMIYTPNSTEFSEEKLNQLLPAALVKITKDFGGYSNRPTVEGNPFHSLRVRSLESFSHAYEMISKHYKGKVFKNIPVVEANLTMMPTTKESLPKEYQQYKDYWGGYVGPSSGSSITFINEKDEFGKDKDKKNIILNQPTPFILINTSTGPDTTDRGATEKEWVVLNSYKKYLKDVEEDEVQEQYAPKDVDQFEDLYAIKRLLYLGWSFDVVSDRFIKPAKTITQFLNAVDRLILAAESLVSEGYKNPISNPYYVTFKIDESFPIDFEDIVDKNTGRMNVSVQATHPFFKSFLILDYDPSTKFILIETPVYVSPEICSTVFNAKSSPFITKYNPVMNKIDVKVDDSVFEEMKWEKKQLNKIKGVVGASLIPEKDATLQYRTGPGAQGAWESNPMIFNVRNISDYYYASDFIKKMCKSVGLPFKDFQIVLGPIELLFGGGVQGGFMDEKLFHMNKMSIPFQLPNEDIMISPPVIFINSVTTPDYAKQTESLIHEYRHYLYGVEYPDYELSYTLPQGGDGQDYKYWSTYLNDPNERAAHKEQIKFELKLGKSVDEVIRKKVGDRITIDNYPIALKFSELVNEALREIEEEKGTNENSV